MIMWYFLNIIIVIIIISDCICVVVTSLTTHGHREPLHHAACSAQGEVSLGVVDHRQHSSNHGSSQVSHGHVHQGVVERLPQLLVHESHNNHGGVEYDGRTGENGHDDGENDVAGA